MNRTRAIVLACGLLAVCGTGIFPPWEWYSQGRTGDAGYHLIVSRPRSELGSSPRLDWSRLAVSWLVIGAATGALLLVIGFLPPVRLAGVTSTVRRGAVATREAARRGFGAVTATKNRERVGWSVLLAALVGIGGFLYVRGERLIDGQERLQGRLDRVLELCRTRQAKLEETRPITEREAADRSESHRDQALRFESLMRRAQEDLFVQSVEKVARGEN